MVDSSTSTNGRLGSNGRLFAASMASQDSGKIFDPSFRNFRASSQGRLEGVVSFMQPSSKEGRQRFNQNICADRVDVDLKDYVPPRFTKSVETAEFISTVLSGMFLMSDLTLADRRMFVQAMASEKVPAGDTIIKQGDIGDFFYILEEGEVSFTVDSREVGTGSKGKSFGELALMYNCPRTASCFAKTECKLWKIDQKTFRFIMVQSTENSDKEVISVLKKVPLFAGLESDFFSQLAKAMTSKHVHHGEVIIKKGDVGDTFYVLSDGEVEISNVGVQRRPSNNISTGRRLRTGESFGERALLTGDVRSATVTACGECDLLCLDRADFEEILGNLEGLLERAMWRQILMNVPMFSEASLSSKELALDTDTVRKLTQAMTVKKVEAGEVIMKKGDVGDTFYVIKDGHVEISDLSDTSMAFGVGDKVLGQGDFFGERALFTGDVRSATVTAVSTTELSCLDRESSERILAPLRSVLDKARWKRILLSIPDVADANLEPGDIDRLLSLISKKSFYPGDDVYEGRELYLVNSGRVSVSEGGVKSTFRAGSFFGASVSTGETFRGSISFLEESVCGLISASEIYSVINSTDDSKPKIGKINLFDLKCFRRLGKGSFGKVFLVTTNDDDTPYALKVMNKAFIHKKKQTSFVLGERAIMAELDHPFLMSLMTAFQDDYSLYMLLAICDGGELYSVMTKAEGRRLSQRSARFYTACILDGLAYLHSKNICHRDLKAENVMLDKDGYCVLIDFGFAKKIDHKTFTLCGTPFYLAPEALLSKGYDKGVDYWAMGVILYEMLIGCEPFFAQDEMGLYRQICEFNYYIPEFVKDAAANLISRIFKKAKKRIGCLAGGAGDIRDHKFFSKTNWASLAEKTVEVPWVPGPEEFYPEDPYERITSDASGTDTVPVTVNAEFASFGYYVENRHSIEDSLRSSGKAISSVEVKPNEGGGGCCIIA